MPYYHEIVPARMYPRMDSLITLHVHKQSGRAWLEFQSTPYLIGHGIDGGQVIRVLIGAVPEQTGGWREIRPNDLPGGSFARIIFPDPEQSFKFQRAIVNEWATFSPQTWKNFTKGWSSRAGLKTITSANFIVKALKTGYTAIGDYSSFGSKYSAWSIDDLVKFMQNQQKGVLSPPGLAAFDAVLPNPYYDAITYAFEGNLASNSDTRLINRIPFAGTRANFIYANELADLPPEFQRCVSYGFRGDTRGPAEIQQSQFLPNFTRPSHITQAMNQQGVATIHQVHQAQPMNLPRFLQNQQLGEFISTSKSVAIARFFATSTWTNTGQMIARSTAGWIYACFVEGGIDIPPQAFNTYLGSITGNTYNVPYNEQELSMPGKLDWDDVMACRKVRQDGRFIGPVYVRPHLEDGVHHAAAPIIYDLLSGKSQGPGAPGEFV